ncbi:MAG TPA: PEP-CTERM sorting domain-containing protein [Candidatus Elarobacter sp.]|nr:PEP-CTERM sorting domain-containing protein [Candidatus Elarobacter sp.]
MQSIIARSWGGATVLALALALAPASAAAQVAGLSTSGVNVVDLSNNSNNTNSCGRFSTPSSSTSEATSAIAGCGPVAGGSASATSSSTNALRTASAMGTANQTGTQGQTDAYGKANSTQYSKLTVTGTPSATDNLVFRFVTTQSLTGNANSNSGYGFWNLTLAGGTNNPVFAQQTAGSGVIISGGTQTAQGFDFTMPFTPTGGIFQYNFTVDAYGYITGQATGATTQTGSLWAMLSGIDAVDGSGAVISSASFDQAGFGTISTSPVAGPPSTVPEPSSMALLATGLVVLIPTARRKRER